MLSSPLQWPLLVIGIAELAVLTWVAIMMAYRQNVQGSVVAVLWR
jgi:hypothetical protein